MNDALTDIRKMVLTDIRNLVDHQAEDEALWFVAETAAEAYVQNALRRLHALIEHLTPAQTRQEPKGLPMERRLESKCDHEMETSGSGTYCLKPDCDVNWT